MSNFKLREVIKQIRSCKTAAEERAVISKESALIRNAFKVSNQMILKTIHSYSINSILIILRQFEMSDCANCVGERVRAPQPQHR